MSATDVGAPLMGCTTTEDTMKRTILLGTLTAALLAPFAVAQAQSNVIISVNTPE